MKKNPPNFLFSFSKKFFAAQFIYDCVTNCVIIKN